jgi:hypothetical protein
MLLEVTYLSSVYVVADLGGPTLAGIAGSDPAGGMDVCLLQVFCVVR